MTTMDVARPVAAGDDPGVQRLARLAGVLYLGLAVLGMFAPLVLESVLEPGDAAATAANVLDARRLLGLSLGAWLTVVVLDVALSVVLYRLLRSAGETLALVTAALRLTYTALLGAFLLHLVEAYRMTAAGQAQTTVERVAAAVAAFDAGFLLALVIFGVHLVGLGALLLRSGAVPRVLAVLLGVAGVGYVVDSLAGLLGDGLPTTATVLILTPAVLGELGLTGWLLVRGVRTGTLREGSEQR